LFWNAIAHFVFLVIGYFCVCLVCNGANVCNTLPMTNFRIVVFAGRDRSYLFKIWSWVMAVGKGIVVDEKFV
jgi:hypothetical protein